MPAPVVLVFDEPTFTEECATALRQVGYEVAAFTDPMRALDALDAANKIDLLITRVKYAPGKPNGVALARMARTKRPDIRILFMAVPTSVEHIAGWGEYISLPATIADVVTAVQNEMDRQYQQPAATGASAVAPTMSLQRLLLLSIVLLLATVVVLLTYLALR